MIEAKKCPECGKDVPADAPGGICPACMLRRGLADKSRTTGPEDESTAERASPPAQIAFAQASSAKPRGAQDVPDDSTAVVSYDKPLALPELPGYKLTREISRGGQGAVFEAVQNSTGRRVAVKMLHSGVLISQQERVRFEREAQVLAALSHPNIVGIVDRGETKYGGYFLVMNFIEGRTLDKWIANYYQANPGGPPPADPAELLRIFLKICDAINASHLRGIVHRDLKPANILVDDRGEPHILDFGVAHTGLPSESEGSPVTVTGMFIGSLPWASPEQAMGGGSRIDTRTDVYSLGVILFQMLTNGKFPYEVVGNMAVVLNNIMNAVPLPPSEILAREDAKAGKIARQKRRAKPSKALNPVIEAIVLKTLSKSREGRYQNAGELARDISHYLAGRPTVAAGDQAFGPNRRMIWTGAGIGILVVGAAAACWIGFGRSDPTLPTSAIQSETTTSPVAATMPDALPTTGPVDTSGRTKIDKLLAMAKRNDNKANAKTALLALDEILKIDPAQSEAIQLRRKVANYFVISDPEWYIDKAIQMSANIVDPTEKTWSYTEIAQVRAALGDVVGARENIQLAKENASTIAEDDKRATADRLVAFAMASVKDTGAAKSIATGINDPFQKAWAFAQIGQAQGLGGDLSGAKATFELALLAASTIKDAKEISRARSYIVRAQSRAGDIDGAQETLAATSPDAEEYAGAVNLVAQARANAGDLEGARRIIDQFTEPSVGWRAARAFAYSRFAELQAGSKDTDGARESIRTAQEAAMGMADPLNKSFALASLAEAQAAAGLSAEATQTLQMAREANAKADKAKSRSRVLTGWHREQIAYAMVVAGRFEDLGTWIDSLEDPFLETYAFLSAARALTPIRLQQGPDSRLAALEGAEPVGFPLDPAKAESLRKSWAKFEGRPLLTTNSIGMKFAYVPRGWVLMGNPKLEAGDNSETQHKVTLTRSFAMGTTPVTQKQWKSIMGTTQRELRDKAGEALKNAYLPGEGDDNPVYFVTWEEATEFCKKLEAREGKTYRLPTEAEWEYACRAGSSKGFGGTGVLEDMGWYADNSGRDKLDIEQLTKELDPRRLTLKLVQNNCKTHPVALKLMNPWALYDMQGNVWEWCSDGFGVYPKGDAVDPKGDMGALLRVVRGGAWNSVPKDCRSFHRRGLEPAVCFDDTGFRVVLEF